MKFAIVIVAYNRPYETKRLLDSVCAADYYNDDVDLIVDIDKGMRQSEIKEVIQDICWTRGKYDIVMRPERMGLRAHIFACGGYTDSYDAVIVLEDDLIVAPSFYSFAKNACERYDSDHRISEISLYSYAVNEFEARPFLPAKNDSDVYAMQVVQSWGECWTKRMWEDFMRSQSYNKSDFPFNDNLHNRVNAWGKNSWKKVFANYLIESNTTVIYPYVSFTSNYSEAGEHCKHIVSDYQVTMQEGEKTEVCLPDLDDCIAYDQFFERIFKASASWNSEICLDLYGSKHRYDGYKLVASTKRLPFKVVNKFGLVRKPQEDNVIYSEPGEGIFLYDLAIHSKLPADNEKFLIQYDFGYLSWRRSLKNAVFAIKEKITDKLKR